MAHTHVCPWWIGYLLASPIRRIFQKPERILQPFVTDGATVLEIGPGMGFFTIPMARMVGESGKIIVVDIQKEMLDGLKRRAIKAGVTARIEYRLGTSDSPGIEDLKESVDFALLFAVVHEIADHEGLFSKVYRALKNEGSALIAEPVSRVSSSDFLTYGTIAEKLGFQIKDGPSVPKSLSMILKKYS